MSRPKKLITDIVYDQVEDLISSIKDSDIVIKLLAIKALRKYKYEEVTEMFSVSRVSLIKWIKAYLQDGINGLKKKPQGHRRSKLNDYHLSQIELWVGEGRNTRGEPTNWTIPKLIVAIKEEFGIEISHTPLWLHLRKLGMRVKIPRPMHHKTSQEIQDAFKKN